MGGKMSAMDPMQIPVPDIKDLMDRDPWLAPFEKEIRRR